MNMMNSGENMQNDRINEEREKIEYIKAKTDMSNPLIVLKVYNMLVEKKMFSTSVGVEFLNELREWLFNVDTVNSDMILPLPEIKEETQKVSGVQTKSELQEVEEAAAATEDYRSDYQLQKVRQYKSEAAVAIRKYEMAKIKIRNYRIVVAFMALMVVLVCVLT